MGVFAINIAGQFKKKNGFGGKEYYYRTELPVRVGSVVAIPTPRGNSPLLVTRTDVPALEIDPEYLHCLTEVTDFYPMTEADMDALF